MCPFVPQPPFPSLASQISALRRECRRLLARIDAMEARLAPPRPVRVMPKRIAAGVIAEMHAFYLENGCSLSATGRQFQRDRRSVGALFVSRGLFVSQKQRIAVRLPDGRIKPMVPFTPAEIDGLIAAASRVRVPECLKQEWRKWPLERRAEFVRRLRAKVRSRRDAPPSPYSANVVPFDYGTPAAWEIARRLNQGRDSRRAVIKIDVCSQGVIYQDRLWFWSPRYGYQGGPWKLGSGRPVLHHIIWQQATGQPVPPHHVLYFKDGNHNNLLAANLALKGRATLLTENKDAGNANRRSTVRFFQMTEAAAQISRLAA